MEELVDRLKKQAGLSDDQALQSIEVVKTFTKEKFPMFADAIDKLFEKYGAAEKEDYLD